MNGLVEKSHAQFVSPLTVGTDSKSDSIGALVSTAVGWISLVVGILAFIYLIYSGILYITAAGNPDQAKKGQQGIINAVIGIIIVVLAYTIITVVKNAATGTLS